jgi:CheY-like chemotaxis protein
MPKFTASLFSNQKDTEKDCEDLLKAALDGQDSIQEMWSLKTKWGKNVNAVLLASARTDSMGVITGVLCVIMPLSPTKIEQPALKLDCNVSAMDHMSILDLEEEQVNSYGSPREDSFLAALEQPPSPYFGEIRDALDMYGDPSNIVYEAEGSSICSQDWCKSEQSSENLRGAGNSLERSSLTQARAMVVDNHARGRKSLSLMLERCGFEVSCVSKLQEALYVFEQSMQDPEGFSIVFVNLDGARAEDHAIIRQLRSLESRCSSPNITTRVTIVAVTDLDRLQDSSQKDVSAGLDAIINYPLRVQQLRDTLNSLGVQIDHLDFANKSSRASYNSWNNPLILAR